MSKSNGGGIASFGASSVSFTYSGSDTANRRWGWIELEIFEELYNNKIVGHVWKNVITEYINNFFSLGWDQVDSKILMSMTVFGDPTLVVDDGDDPQNIQVNKFIFYRFIERFLAQLLILQKILLL